MPAATGAVRRLFAGLFPARTTAAIDPVARPLWPAWLVALLAVGVAARFRFFLSAPSYWYDEAFLLVNVFERSFGNLVGAIDYQVVVAPGFAWLERIAYLALGRGELAMRLLPFLAGLATLAALAVAGRRVVGGWAWWLPVAMVAVSRNAIRHGGEAKQYAFDMLTAAVVILPAVAFVRARAEGRTGRWALAGVVAAAALAPWVSFPAAFAVGGACAALFLHALRTGRAADWWAVAGVTAVAAASAAALWWFHARHLYYPGLTDHWGASGQGGFPEWGNTASVALWPVNSLLQAGRYALREAGFLLLPLAVLGAVRLWRQNPPVAAAVVVPVLLAVAASCVGKYPLGNRTTVCLLPGLCLAAAAGVGALAEWFPSRRVAPAVAAALLAVSACEAAGAVVRPVEFPEAREAFEAVHAARQPGDVVWAQHLEIDITYRGPTADVFGVSTPPRQVIRRAKSGRVWVVVNPPPPGVRTPFDDVIAALAAAGFRETERHNYRGVVTYLYTR